MIKKIDKKNTFLTEIKSNTVNSNWIFQKFNISQLVYISKTKYYIDIFKISNWFQSQTGKVNPLI